MDHTKLPQLEHEYKLLSSKASLLEAQTRTFEASNQDLHAEHISQQAELGQLQLSLQQAAHQADLQLSQAQRRLDLELQKCRQSETAELQEAKSQLVCSSIYLLHADVIPHPTISFQAVAESAFRVEIRDMNASHEEELRTKVNMAEELQFQKTQLEHHLIRLQRVLDDTPSRYKVLSCFCLWQ